MGVGGHGKSSAAFDAALVRMEPNGMVIALSAGNPSTHARLFVLNAATGAELYSSKDEIATYADLSGVSVGDSHAFFTDHDNVLYSFGIGLEH